MGALFVPVVCAVLSKRKYLPKEAAVGSAILGSLGTAASQLSGMGFVGALLPLGFSLLGFVLGFAFSKRRSGVAEAM